ncbi:hypothetical protein D3C84_324770 [compost metagenome]
MKLAAEQIVRIESLVAQFGELQAQKVALGVVLDNPEFRQPNLSRDQSAQFRRAHEASRKIVQQQQELRLLISSAALASVFGGGF